MLQNKVINVKQFPKDGVRRVAQLSTNTGCFIDFIIHSISAVLTDEFGSISSFIQLRWTVCDIGLTC